MREIRIIKSLLLVAILSILTSVSSAQHTITFSIKSLPMYTPPSDTLFLCTSLNEWELASNEYRFKKNTQGFYTLTIAVDSVQPFEYKINRGNWNKVEGTLTGEFASNRSFNPLIDSILIDIKVLSWQDLHKEFYPTVKVKLLSVPSNTPHDAEIYIVGSFNAWNQSDPAYLLTKMTDGSYQGEIKAGYGDFFYKFTRGSWESVEGRWDGGAKSNREFSFSGSDGSKNIVAEVVSWQDLSKSLKWKEYLVLIMFLSIIQLFIVVCIVYKKPLLLIAILLVLFGFGTKLLVSQTTFFNMYPKALIIPGCFLPGISVFLFKWLQSELFIVFNKRFPNILNVGLILFPFVAIVPILSMSTLDFKYQVLDNKTDIYLSLIYSYGLLVNLTYSYLIMNLVRSNRSKLSPFVYSLARLLKDTWMYISLIAVFGFVLYLIFKIDSKLITDWTELLIWGFLGISALIIQYRFIKYSKIQLKSVNLLLVNKEIKQIPIIESTIIENSLYRQLLDLMEYEKVYENEKLTLSDLASYLKTNTLYVSKLINENFNKNFADFVNTYRIKAFIKNVENDENKKKSFLEHSKQVGFNSKSSFNRAFKKYSGKTPSEYF